jgi:alanine racemase
MGDAKAGGLLTIDLDAVAENYRRLRAQLARAVCGAAVKADAYGLGVAQVAPALARAGCRDFFVAHLDEGIVLRPRLPEAAIYVLNGVLPGEEADFAAHRLIPALNSLPQIDRWAKWARDHETTAPAAIHVDTGMSRLGLEDSDLDSLAQDAHRLAGIDLRLVMSHLACAEETENPMNEAQRTGFERARRRLPDVRASLANSSGIFLGPAYQFDLARPGAGLYGVNPTPGRPNPMLPVIRLEGKIVQVRDIDHPRTVGYGAAHSVRRRSKIATVAIGYADGYLRSLSGRGLCRLADFEVPIVGRVSMDLITLDVTDVPDAVAVEGAVVEMIGATHTVDDVADKAGTNGYEILTGLGPRYQRRYMGTGA